MRHLLLICTALALSASAVTACPYGKKDTEATAPVERPQSTAAASQGEQSKPMQVATGEKESAAVTK